MIYTIEITKSGFLNIFYVFNIFLTNGNLFDNHFFYINMKISVNSLNKFCPNACFFGTANIFNKEQFIFMVEQ